MSEVSLGTTDSVNQTVGREDGVMEYFGVVGVIIISGCGAFRAGPALDAG